MSPDTEIGRSDWEPWVHSQGSLSFLSGERPVTAGATVDGTRTGAVVESSVELTPSPHGSFLRHYHSQFAAVIPNSRRNKLAQKAEELALMRDVSKAAQEIDVR
jgi:hypothetical protein